jgi:GNAT superfamily N-acetyltransferase
MEITFRNAVPNDLPAIMDIVNAAKKSLADKGIDQWQRGYPNEDVILIDMGQNESYVLTINGILAGTLMVTPRPEPNYDQIYEGLWRSNSDHYATIHRIAISPGFMGRGLASMEMVFAEQMARTWKCSSIRVDTDAYNHPMRKTIVRAGYNYCGIIRSQEDLERVAFEKLLS